MSTTIRAMVVALCLLVPGEALAHPAPFSYLDLHLDASGGSGHGFKIGPAIGRELADWIVDERTSADFARLSYDRVAQGALFTQAYGGNRG